jgi:nanoRNase/pAp phosphatase (c-di-AMP/oligoRNAs hydrolase)
LYEMIKFLNLKHKSKDLYNSLFVSIWTDTSGLVERNPTKQTFKAIEWLEKNGLKRKEIVKKINLSKKEKKIIKNYILNAKIKNNFAYKINDKILINYLYRPSTELFFKTYDAQIYLFASLNKKNKYRIGLRSKKYNVSNIAKKFGGGGHITSAGIEVNTKKDVKNIILYILGRNINENA